MRVSASAVLLLTLMAATVSSAQVNMGDQKAEASVPFTMTKVASFETQIWRIAFMPDGRFLATEKGGRLWLMTQRAPRPPSPTCPRFSIKARAACWACSSRRTMPPIITSI